MGERYNLDYEMIGNKISRMRKTKNMTQSQLAEKVNLSVNAISKMEINYMKVSLKSLVHIANALDVDINYFLTNNDSLKDEAEEVTIFVNHLISDMTNSDRQFIINVISALENYKSDE
ncbi:MAG: helix-turn-helix domain-containing protein [Lachnospirales bacterium]